jgi:hypothetical protein
MELSHKPADARKGHAMGADTLSESSGVIAAAGAMIHESWLDTTDDGTIERDRR